LEKGRARSLIRFSPIMDSLFSKATILVENETDALFYSETIEAYLRSSSNRKLSLGPDDLLFLSVGGKSALGRTAELVRSLRSVVLVAADFDVVDDWGLLENALKGLGVGDRSTIHALHKTMLMSVDKFAAKVGYEKAAVMGEMKNAGLTYGDPELQLASAALLAALDEVGMTLSHVGELEDFDSELRALHGKTEWANQAVRVGRHHTEEARKFAERLLCKLVGSKSPLA
ncbi:MAG: TOPRIM nucleotidyl transferase/hydrolase domain-containing protein, partial [Dietzia cercidiphylli]